MSNSRNGAFHRKAPTGGCANGTPLNDIASELAEADAVPRTVPPRVIASAVMAGDANGSTSIAPDADISRMTHRALPRLLRLAGVMVTLALASGAGASAYGEGPASPVPSPGDPATIPGYDHDPLSLLGPSRVDAAHLAAFVSSHNPRTTVTIEELAEIFLQEGAALGVRADLAWTQSIIETGFFHFPDRGMLHPQDNNFAGIGACDSCNSGRGYPDARTGVRAQMQLLRGYADPNPLQDAMIRPPKSYRGSAPTWWQMGNGHWATAPHYAAAITSMYGRMLKFSDIDLAYVAPAPLVGASIADATTEPVARAGDGLYIADPDGQVYDLGDTRFWGSAYGARDDASVTSIAMTPKAKGYWLFYSDGVVLPFGNAEAFGRAPTGTVAVAARPRGLGYWTVDRNGAVVAFGNAEQLPAAKTELSARVVDIAATRSGKGYWLVDSLGRISATGDAVSLGDATGVGVDDPVVGLAITPWDDGYWIVTAGGTVHAIGAAQDHGGVAAEFSDDADREQFTTQPARDYVGLIEASQRMVVAVRTSPTGDGYWLVMADGAVYGRGDAPDFDQVHTNGAPVLSATSRIDTAPALRT